MIKSRLHVPISHKILAFHLLLFFVALKINAQVVDQPVKDSVVIVPSDKHFKVGLFLPFFKDGGDTTGLQHAFALSSLDYLAGVKIAIDSVEKVGNVVIDFYVEDTELDSSIVESLLNMRKYKDLDVLIGPIFKSGVEMAAPIIENRTTIMYLPFEKDFNYSNLSNMMSSQKNVASFANYFSYYFSREFNTMGKDLVLIYNSKEGKTGRESRAMDSIIKINLSGVIDSSSIKIFDIASKENINFSSRLNKKKRYLFFINTKNTYYANIALSQISKLKSDSPEVYCMDEILESETPAYETWDSLRVKFFSRFFVNYEDESISALRKKTIEDYNQDPVEFTYKGYNDIIFLSQAFTHGADWLEQCINKEFENEVSGFYYYRDNVSQGVFNGYHWVWRYEKLKLYRVY